MQRFASEWKEQKPFKGENAMEHASKLTKDIEKAITAGDNVLIPGAQEADLPLQPIRGTPFEKLMVSICFHASEYQLDWNLRRAEPGAGKSTAAALAALELLGRQSQDVYRTTLNGNSRFSSAFPTPSLLRTLPALCHPPSEGDQTEGNNVLDDGVIDQGDNIRVLTRAACDNLHHIIFIVQSEAAEEDISALNGDATNISPQQMPAPLYWSEEETLALLNCSDDMQKLCKKRLSADAGAEAVEGLTAEVLEQSKIPDEFGRWRPRSTKLYINPVEAGRQYCIFEEGNQKGRRTLHRTFQN